MPLQEVHTGFTFNFDGSKMAAIQRGVKRAEVGLNSAATHVATMQQKMGGMLTQAKGVIGAYLGFRAIKLFTSDYADAGDMIAKFASGLGISTQEYQRLTHAAQLNGLTIEELNMALPKLAKSAGDAADGSKSMALGFQRAGVELRGIDGNIKGPIQLLTEMADGMKNVKDKGRKTQILMNIFGRAGKKMGVLLDQGSDGIRRMMAEADKLGLVMSGKQLKAAEKYKDEMLRLKAILTGVRNVIASKLLPAITGTVEAFRKWWAEGRNAERTLRALKLVAIFTGIVIARLIGAGVLRNMKLFVQGVWAGVQALRAMGIAGAMAAIKIWAIIAAVALVGLLIHDLVRFAQGKDSALGRLLGDGKLGKDLKGTVLELWRVMKKFWKDIQPALKSLKAAFIALGDALKPLGKLIAPAMWEIFIGSIEATILAIEVLTTLISGLTNVIKWLPVAWDEANAAVNRWLVAVETAVGDAGRAIVKAWDDANAAINKVLTGIETKASNAAKAVGNAWDAAMGGVRSAVDALMASLQKVLDLKDRVFGKTVSLGNLDKLSAVKKLEGLSRPPGQDYDVTDSGHHVLKGILGPKFSGGPLDFGPGVPAFPGQGLRAHATVAPGAIQVTVHAKGDAAEIAAQVKTQVNKSIGSVFTSASRDLVKAPQGQR